MKVLIVGGTGLISLGIAKHLATRGADVTLFCRGQRASSARPPLALPPGAHLLVGDRFDERQFVNTFEQSRYAAVIDMICFSERDAECTVRAFAGRCDHLLFCSTVCTYGVKTPGSVLVDETFPQEPISAYGRDKLACERIFARSHAAGAFPVTIVRPSHTYGPGAPLLDQLEANGVAWDRIARGLPILCAGDGLGLWQSTHRDDCGKLFAHAVLNPTTYGEAYNATRDEVFTWRDWYRHVARALGAPARLIFAPAGWLLASLPQRFGFLREITQYHGAYSSAKAKAHVPEFRATIGLEEGARETLADVRRRDAWRDSSGDVEYQRVVDAALALGFPCEEA
jgi:nucleoside-diphosphate-sugar epimerase